MKTKNETGAEAADKEPKVFAPGEIFHDAKVMSLFKEADYQTPFITTSGSNRDSFVWTPRHSALYAVIDLLCRHQEGDKDGVALVFADMVPGRRLKTSVKTVTAIGLDFDTGIRRQTLDAAIGKLNCLAVRYSTHSHGKRSTEFKKDKVLKHYPDEEITDELMQKFCLAVEAWEPQVAETVKFIEQDHTEQGIVLRISHDEMEKHRVIIPLRDPYEIAKEGKTQFEAMAKWAKYPAALAKLLNVPFDRSCTDPSRLFYPPRHAEGAQFNISLFGGALFNRGGLELDDAFDAMVAELTKKSGKTKTEEGKKLGQWSHKTAHGFQLATALEIHAPDKLRGPASMGYNAECPFDEDHSNSGDQGDRAFWVVNAAEGGNELFIASCRHESCHDKTMLDMVGKMVKDGWFDRDVLYDPELNIAISDEEIAAEKVEAENVKVLPKLTKLLEQIARLKESKDQHSDILKIVDAAIAAELDPLQLDDVKAKVREAAGHKTKKPLSDLFKERKGAASKNKATRTTGPEAKFWYYDEGKLAAAMDETKLAVVALGSQRRFVVFDHNDMPQFLYKSDAEIAFAQYQYFQEPGAKGEDGFKVWLRSPYRFAGYDEVVFRPGDGPVQKNVLNLWRGWGVEPKKGDWSLLRDHIENVVCDGDKEQFQFYMAFWAQTFQDPTVKPGVAPVLVGPKGCGKSIVPYYARKLIPKNSKVVEKAKSWVGQFNSGLAHCLLLCVEEAMFAGSHEHDSAMKHLITSDQLLYEAKCKDAVEGPNYTRVHITSNENWVVPATPGERRYFVMKVNPARVKDFDYFKAIGDQMDNGGCAAFLYEMLNWDYSKVNLREVPETDGLRDQILTGLDPKLKWLASVLEEGCFPFKDGRGPDVTSWMEAFPDKSARRYAADCDEFEIGEDGGPIPKKIVYASYRDFCPGFRGPDTDEAIALFLRSLGLDLAEKRMTVENHDRPRAYVFPNLLDMREAFLKLVPTYRFRESGPKKS